MNSEVASLSKPEPKLEPKPFPSPLEAWVVSYTKKLTSQQSLLGVKGFRPLSRYRWGTTNIEDIPMMAPAPMFPAPSEA